MFNETVLTKKGIALNNKVQAGYATIEYLRVGLGKGTYEKNEKLEDQENLKEEKQSVPISSIKIIDEKTVKLRVVINNEGITEGYDITEIGLYATDPEEGEILYSVANATEGKADYQPSKTEVVDYQITIDLYSTVSNSNNVTIKLDTGAVALAADLIQLKEDMSQGDISENVIETLDTVEDKYPVPAAGESVKRFFGKVLTFLRNIRPLTGDINIYVSTTGSDLLGDGSELNPFKTIQHAIDIIPKDLNGHTVTVWVADGTYDESITISGFKTGKFILRTFRSSTLSSLTKITHITCVYNTAYIQIDGFEITTVSNDGILCNHCTDVRLSFMKIIAVASTFKAIYGAEVNLFRVWNCELSNKKYAVYVANAYGYVNECIGTSNNIGIYAYSASTIHMAANSIGATTPLVADWGSMFINANGTQILDLITSGLSCTWGTISGGYRRVGNASGYAQIILNVRIAITQDLTAGTLYRVGGFPLVADGVPIACTVDDPYRTKTCYVTNNPTYGFIYFLPLINLVAGQSSLSFSATYITSV